MSLYLQATEAFTVPADRARPFRRHLLARRVEFGEDVGPEDTQFVVTLRAMSHKGIEGLRADLRELANTD